MGAGAPATAAPFASVQASTWLLAFAVTATGVRSNMQSLTQEGLRPMLVIIIATVVALALAAAAAAFLIA